jgi:catechol 2,3-dioxygenase-like lactoylglutathione lyase family enzyme
MQEMMTTVLRNPDHVTIAVADAATAIEFFALLGFRKQHIATIDGGLPAKYMGMPDMKAQHITLALEGCEPRFEIQLLEFDPRPADDPGEHPTNLRRRGYNHLAFRVDDIEAVTTHLVGNGVTMLSDEMDYISRRLRLFQGPEGITLELVQWVDSDSEQG